MSDTSSFRAALERPAETPAGRPAPSGSRVRLLLKASGGVSHPVAVARTLSDLGMSLRAAHAAVDRLAEGESHGVEIVTEDTGKAIDLLGELGVQAAAIRRPTMVAKAVREGFGLSQKDFAIRFGLELRTVQNWEQERHGLDAATTILLALIAHSPESVERVLTSSP